MIVPDDARPRAGPKQPTAVRHGEDALRTRGRSAMRALTPRQEDTDVQADATFPTLPTPEGAQQEQGPAARRPDAAAVRPADVWCRWMINRDLAEVLAIERASFPLAPWGEEDFRTYLRQRDHIAQVAERAAGPDPRPVRGYLLYEVAADWISLDGLATHPAERRRGVGAAMVGKLLRKLSPKRRRRLVTRVRESNLDAQQFFRALGLRAVRVERRHFADSGEDAYVMEFAL